jgi:hypothetical protein
MRHMTNEPPVGPDQNMRCGYRDIFLKRNAKGPELRELIIHELSHTGANHNRWRDDDHGEDFQKVYNLIENIANDINFLDYLR